MTRVVLDTNVIVSALLSPNGAPAQLLLLALGGPVRMCVSGSVYAEYEEVIRRPKFRLTEMAILSALEAIRERCLWVRPEQRIQVCADPDDDVFLECAQGARASFLITGNVHHFPTSWHSIAVVTPRCFLDILSERARFGSV